MKGPKNSLRMLMGVYAFVYLAFGLVLLITPGGVLRLINGITNLLGLSPALKIPPYPFWAMVSVSLLLTLALMCYLAFRDVEKIELVWLMIFAKYASAFCLAGYLLLGRDHPPGFGVGALVDASLGTVALVFLLRARVGAGG